MDLSAAFNDLPTLETARLTLRRMSPRDLADVFAYGKDPEVSRMTLWEPHRSIDETRIFVNDVLLAGERGEPNPWVIVLKASGKVIGTIGVGELAPAHGRCEVGYVVAHPHWNQGYATEALRAVLRFCFNDLRLNRVEARCFPHNGASSRVMEKAGMRFEGVMRQYLFAKGVFQDVKVYSVLAEEYESPAS